MLCVLGAVGAVLAGSVPIVQATGTGFEFDLATMKFQYVVTNAGALPGEKIGELTIADETAYGSNLTLQKLDLGPNGVVGGDDTVLDYAKIMSADSFDAVLVSDVIKLATNSYRITGAIKVTDTLTTLASPKYVGSFTSNTVSMSGGTFFYFVGPVATLAPNDALLQPAASPWQYEGVLADTPSAPDEDGVRGRVTLAFGRGAYTHGDLNGGVIVGSAMNLDAFFSANRDYINSTLQATAIPEPVTFGTLIIGIGWLLRRRR